MKDLVIGGASNYSWNELKFWINSIQRTGFDGDVVLVVTNISAETIDILKSKNIKLYVYGNRNSDGSYKSQNNMAPHVERFFCIWNFLNHPRVDDYRNVVVTDTRDVIFQKNPSSFMEKSPKPLIASSEGLFYKDEPWGNRNITECFGIDFSCQLKHKMIYNVGTVAGRVDYVRDLLLMIYQMSLNRSIPVVDQAVYNFILNIHPYVDNTYFSTNRDGWAIQLGTTIGAIKAGSGDIGIKIKNGTPSDLIEYELAYKDTQPIFDGKSVFNGEGKEYAIVHQYDRVPEINEIIREAYK